MTGSMRPIRRLCKAWLRPVELANEWIVNQRQRGHAIDNLEEFRDCVEEMIAIVEFNEHDDWPMSEAVIRLSESARTEHGNGETVEFI